LTSVFPSYFQNSVLTYCIEQSPSWEANRSSASQDIHRILRNPKVHYRIHIRPPPVTILIEIDPVRSPHPTSRRSLLILFSHLCLGLPSDLLPLGFPTKTSTHLFSPPCVLHALDCTEGSVWFRRFRDGLVTWLRFYGEELLAPRETPSLEDRPLSAVRGCIYFQSFC
jgi:hypothetical protein